MNLYAWIIVGALLCDHSLNVLTEVFVVDGSRRSTKANAFFTGFGRNKRIALYDTLVENHPVEELVTVVAHEVGHCKKRHILQGMGISIMHTGILLFVLSLFLSHRGLFQAFFLETVSVHAGLIFFGMLVSPIERGLSVILHAWMRRNEYAADRFAAWSTGAGEAFAAALKRLSRDHLENLTPHPLYVWLHFSHPPVLARIRALESGG